MPLFKSDLIQGYGRARLVAAPKQGSTLQSFFPIEAMAAYDAMD